MDYEKAYKDALSRAKDCHVNKKFSELDDNAQQLCEYIFPELKESDEMIRKKLINFIKEEASCATLNANRLKFKSMLAWLEKQGEQKSVLPGFEEQEGVAGRDYIPVEWVEAIENYGKWKIVKVNEQKPAWSDEDEKWIDRACMLLDELNHLETLTLAKIPHNLDDIINHLKSIKDRVQPQPKQEWSISDERILNNIFTYLGYAKDGNKYCTPELICEAENWLKSLKPQPHWKPTEEQIHCFKCVIDFYKTKVNDTIVLNLLNSLYNELKNF